MMKGRTPLLVGLVVLLGAVVFVFSFGSLEKGMNLEGGYRVGAVFDDATGLVERSRVTLSGIPVGQIVDIGLDENDPSKARVTMLLAKSIKLHEGELDPSTGTWVNGAAAMRLQASLLGDYYISITPGIAGPEIPAGGDIHNVVTESGLGAILDQLEESSSKIFPKLEKITDDIAAVTGSIRSAIGDEEGAAALAKIRDDVSTTTGQIAALSTEVRTFINEEVFPESERLQEIMKNVAHTTQTIDRAASRATARLDSILGDVDGMSSDLRRFVADHTLAPDQAAPGTVASAIKNADDSLVELEGTLENVRSVSAKIDQGEGSVGRLINDDELIDQVEGVVEDVRGFTSTFGRLQVKIEFRAEYLFMQNALKNYVNISLHPKPDKFYFFQIVDDPSGKRNYKQRVTTSNDPSKPPVLVEDIVTTESELKFTAQLAKKWHFLTFRYGIMESTGGWGIDVNLLEDALRFKLDVFEFGRDDFPRVRILAAYEFVRHIYVAAGVDEILNNDTRDYFIGLGVSFTDDDIKGLLPFIPF